MITHETENHIILCPKFKIFSQKAVDEVTNLIKQTPKTKSIAIDMSNIYSISDKFLEMLNTSKEKLILLNTPADIMVVLNLTNTDKCVKLFANNIDLEEDKRELRNRKFSLV